MLSLVSDATHVTAILGWTTFLDAGHAADGIQYTFEYDVYVPTVAR